MNRQSLKDRLAAYFRKNHSLWIASGDIQRLASEKTSYTPSNVSRRLRELENEGVLEVQYRKGHAHYRLRIHVLPGHAMLYAR
jgi:DNA-binding transcriptional ArsR family regulator